MFLCPITKTKLINASAGGGRLYYSKASGGRLVTYSMMRFFIGSHAAREIFQRSRSHKTSVEGLGCPSCPKKMRMVAAPSWTGGHDLEVCPSCQLFWISKHMQPEVPAAEDMLTESGDWTHASEVVKEQAKILVTQDNNYISEEFRAPKDSINKLIGALTGLPVEVHKRNDPFGLLGKLIGVFIIALYFYCLNDNSYLIKQLGFYPARPLLDNVSNIFVSPFLHGSLLHLIGNIYFFFIFSNDVESFLRPVRYVFFILFSITMTSVLSSFLSVHGDVPHIGFSAVISSLLVFYALQFPRTRLAFCIPTFLYRLLDRKGGYSHINFEFRWIRLPIYLVFIWWVIKEVGLYLLYEKNGIGNVAHSGHLAGYISGLLLWFLWGKRESKVEDDLGNLIKDSE